MIRQVLIPYDGGLRGFDADELIRMDADGAYSYVFFEDKTKPKGWDSIRVSYSLSCLERLVQGWDFERVSRSTVISYKYFNMLCEGSVIKLRIACGGLVTLGDEYRAKFFNHFRRLNSSPKKETRLLDQQEGSPNQNPV